MPAHASTLNPLSLAMVSHVVRAFAYNGAISGPDGPLLVLGTHRTTLTQRVSAIRRSPSSECGVELRPIGLSRAEDCWIEGAEHQVSVAITAPRYPAIPRCLGPPIGGYGWHFECALGQRHRGFPAIGVLWRVVWNHGWPLEREVDATVGCAVAPISRVAQCHA